MADTMEAVDYSQTAEDHQSFLVLIRPTGKLLSWKHFSRCWDRISQLSCVAVPGQKRDMWIRYKRNYSKDSNCWGDFQVHRKALGLISIGKCTNEKEFEELFESYKKEKEQYSDTLYNSKLIVFGLNSDGSEISAEQRNALGDESDSPITFRIGSNDHVERRSCDSPVGVTSPDDSADSKMFGDVPIDPLRKPIEERVESALEESGDSVKDLPENITEDSKPQITFTRTKSEKIENKGLKTVKQSVSRNSSSSSVKDLPGSEVVYYPSVDRCEGLEENVREFVTSLFFVLDGKRLDRSFERGDKSQLLCAPFEKKDFVGVDTDTKSYKKKCQGRLRKHLADLCLLAGLPGEAILHYSTAIDILKPVNDWLWIAACHEGLCAASVIMSQRGCQQLTSVRRNLSFSAKHGVAAQDKQKQGSMMHSYNGLQELTVPDVTPSKGGLSAEDIVEKYKDALMYYSKYKNAAVVEMEASFKACRVLILHRKYLEASDFLQNVVYINLQLSDEDRIARYSTLSALYGEIGFRRKEAFFKRVAAMQCVAPQNPRHNWTLCHQLLVQALPGYRIYLDPSESTAKPGQMNGWPVIQQRVLHELMYSARRMGNIPLAVRYMTLLLYTQLEYLTPTEKKELVVSIQNLTAQHEGTTQPLALDSGVIIPHVPLLNLPLVKSFKLMPLEASLQPKKLKSTHSSSDSVFIFTPLSLGAVDASGIKTDMDFSWVEGDMAEVQLLVSNPMPDELRISQITLLSEGLELESFPATPSVPAESVSYLVKIILRPCSPGDLKISGYSTKVYGVKSNCKLKDCLTFPETYYKVKVVPALPHVTLTCSLPKSASFLSFGEEFNIVTSAAAVLYTGQSSECTVMVQNSGKLPVDQINVGLETSRDNREYISEVIQWNSENVQSQLPIRMSGMLCFGVALSGVGTFLPHSPKATKSVEDGIRRCYSGEGKAVEAILRVEYSGGPGLAENYCRMSSIAFTVDILPSLVFVKWDVMLSESSDHCYLLFDLQNISGHDMDVLHSNQCVHLRHEQIKRICVEIERSEPKLFHADSSTSDQFSKFLSTFVDIRWNMPSQNVSGKVGIDHLHWTPEQQQLVYISPVSWDVRLNGQLISPLHIGSLEYQIGQLITVDVDVNIKTDDDDLEGREGVVCICCCQCCDNGSVNYSVDSHVSVLGSESLVIPKISVVETISHSCMYMFNCSGFYKFEIKMQVKGQGESLPVIVQGQILPLKGQGQISVRDEGQRTSYAAQSGLSDTSVLNACLDQGETDRTFHCSSVIEVNILD